MTREPDELLHQQTVSYRGSDTSDIPFCTDKDDSPQARPHYVSVCSVTERSVSQIDYSVSQSPDTTHPNTQLSDDTTHPNTQLSDEAIKENLTKHKQAILHSLNLSQLVQLVDEFELDEQCDNKHLQRSQKAELILDQVKKRNAYSFFLASLEADSEHMGHRYIVSLLRGETFAVDKDVQKSSKLLDGIRKHKSQFVKELNVKALEGLLEREDLLTRDELEDLQNTHHTTQDRSKKLLMLLKTKGPTAHLIFIHNCLALETTHLAHTELYNKLTGNRKRKANTDICLRESKVTKRYPCFLSLPDGIQTSDYYSRITEIRKCHLKGRGMWQRAEDIYIEVMGEPTHPLEMKIAILLESCTMYITDNQPDVVQSRVQQARSMCLQLHSHPCNSQALDARCEWVLANLYRYLKENTKADKHIQIALSKVNYCEAGEDRALTSYCHACILLGRKERSLGDTRTAIGALTTAVGCANLNDYGLDVSHCKIRLAQAHIGSSTHEPGGTRGEVSSQSIEEAKKVLSDINRASLEPRSLCMYSYTWSDVYRMNGEVNNAESSAQEALDIATTHNFKSEISSSQTRLTLLEIYNSFSPNTQ